MDTRKRVLNDIIMHMMPKGLQHPRAIVYSGGLCRGGLGVALSLPSQGVQKTKRLYTVLKDFVWVDQRVKVCFISCKVLCRCEECFINWSIVLCKTSQL